MLIFIIYVSDFSMASILDNYQLTIEKFEGAIAVGRNMQQILTMFRKTSQEMDEWCQENYGGNYRYVYEVVKQMTLNEYFEAIKELGFRGNPGALNIINNAIKNLDGDNTIKIVFENGSVNNENDEDKLNDKDD